MSFGGTNELCLLPAGVMCDGGVHFCVCCQERVLHVFRHFLQYFPGFFILFATHPGFRECDDMSCVCLALGCKVPQLGDYLVTACSIHENVDLFIDEFVLTFDPTLVGGDGLLQLVLVPL